MRWGEPPRSRGSERMGGGWQVARPLGSARRPGSVGGRRGVLAPLGPDISCRGHGASGGPEWGLGTQGD